MNVPYRRKNIKFHHDNTLRTLIALNIVLVGAIHMQSAQAQNGNLRGAVDRRQQVFLSLNEALSTALENNLDISIERLNPEIEQGAITETAQYCIGRIATAREPTSGYVMSGRPLFEI